MARDYDKLRQLLIDQESFPTDFMHKFIGRNTPTFEAAVVSLVVRYPTLRQHARKASAGANHLAMTFLFRAASADEIIELLKATETLEDLLVML